MILRKRKLVFMDYPKTPAHNCPRQLVGSYNQQMLRNWLQYYFPSDMDTRRVAKVVRAALAKRLGLLRKREAPTNAILSRIQVLLLFMRFLKGFRRAFNRSHQALMVMIQNGYSECLDKTGSKFWLQTTCEKVKSYFYNWFKVDNANGHFSLKMIILG